MALCTLQEVKDYLDIQGTNTTSNTVIGGLCDAVSSIADAYCGRTLESTTHTEYYSAYGSSYLVLNNYPITSVSGVYDDVSRVWDDDTIIDSADYIVDSNIIYLNGYYFSGGAKAVKVVYTAGYTSNTIPQDLKQAAIMEVAHLYRKASIGVDVNSRSTGDNSTSYNITDLQPNTKLIFNLYKRLMLC